MTPLQRLLQPQLTDQLALESKIVAVEQSLLRCAKDIQRFNYDPALLRSLLEQQLGLEIELRELMRQRK